MKSHLKKAKLLEKLANQFNLGEIRNSKELTGGIVNVSYKLETSEGQFILQQLSPILDKRVIDDYCSVQRHLRTNGLHVPVLLNDINHKPCYTIENRIWRAFEFVENDGIQRSSPDIAYEAGLALGKFHKIMQSSKFEPTFKIEGFHDTRMVLRKLERILKEQQYEEKSIAVKDEVSFIRKKTNELYLEDNLPKTLIHGDPKLANFLFKDNRVISILDLDTMMSATELIDLGDAMRSWCKLEEGIYEPEIFSAALIGYRKNNQVKYSDKDIKNAMKLITLELSARFLIDYFEEKYFVFDETNLKSRAEQNLEKTRFILNYFNSMGN